MKIVEYKLHAVSQGMTTPGFVRHGGHYSNPDDKTMLGLSVNSPSQFSNSPDKFTNNIFVECICWGMASDALLYPRFSAVSFRDLNKFPVPMVAEISLLII